MIEHSFVAIAVLLIQLNIIAMQRVSVGNGVGGHFLHKI